MDSWQVLSVAVAVLGSGIAGAALARLPDTRVRLPLYGFVLAGVLWCVGDVFADAATTLAAKQVGIAILYTGAMASPALWWLVAIRWAEESGARLPLRSPIWDWLPLAWMGALWLLLITNPWHGQFLTPVVGGRNTYLAPWYAMAIPGYLMVAASFCIACVVAWRIPRKDVRRQAAFIVAAGAVSLIGNALYVLQVPSVNPTVFMLSVSISLLLVGMARDGLFGVMPNALSTIAARHPDGVIVVTSDGYLGYTNQRAHEMLAPVTLQSDRRVFETLQNPTLESESTLPSNPSLEAEWWRAMTGPTGALFRVHGDNKRWIRILVNPIDGWGSAGTGWLLIMSDVTARRQAALHAAQTRRLDSVAALARSVSRDFRSAFAIVRANAELLEREAGNNRSERQIARIFEASQVGADLAQELLLYSGGVHSVHATIELSELVDETCALVEPDLPAGVQIHHRSGDRMFPIEADPRQIRDEGGGMDAETEERAFEPFFSTRHKDRGTGLSTVLGIARAHGALVALENDPGWGCTFTVYFRLSPAASAS